jgi:hypothetical protein
METKTAGDIAERMRAAGTKTFGDFIILRWLALPSRERARQFLAASKSARARTLAALDDEQRARVQADLDALSPEERESFEREGARRRAEADAELWYCDRCGDRMSDDGSGEPLCCHLCLLCYERCCECEEE